MRHVIKARIGRYDYFDPQTDRTLMCGCAIKRVFTNIPEERDEINIVITDKRVNEQSVFVRLSGKENHVHTSIKTGHLVGYSGGVVELYSGLWVFVKSCFDYNNRKSGYISVE